MTDEYVTNNPELDALFERFRAAPNSHVFAPLADACRKAGMIEEAIDIVNRGILGNPDYPSGHVVRGKCYYDFGNAEEAETSFSQVLVLDSNNLVALKYLGMILAERGDYTGARDRFKHILALDPDDKEIKYKLEDLGAKSPPADPVPPVVKGEPMELRDIPDEAFEGSPISLGGDDSSASDELATVTLADIYAAQGYRDKALRIYREVLKRQPDNADVRRKIEALSEENPASVKPSETTLRASVRPVSPLPGEAAFEEVTDSDGRPVRTRVKDEDPVMEVEMAETTGRPSPPTRSPRSGKDYEQFKRWLKNLSD